MPIWRGVYLPLRIVHNTLRRSEGPRRQYPRAGRIDASRAAGNHRAGCNRVCHARRPAITIVLVRRLHGGAGGGRREDLRRQVRELSRCRSGGHRARAGAAGRHVPRLVARQRPAAAARAHRTMPPAAPKSSLRPPSGRAAGVPAASGGDASRPGGAAGRSRATSQDHVRARRDGRRRAHRNPPAPRLAASAATAAQPPPAPTSGATHSRGPPTAPISPATATRPPTRSQRTTSASCGSPGG